MEADATPRPLRIIKKERCIIGSTRAFPPRPASSELLDVPKQRRARIGGSTLSHPTTLLRQRSELDRQSHDIARCTTRATTDGPSTETIGFERPHGLPYRLSSLQSYPTQPSLRSRLISRVMNGVSSKTDTSKPTLQRVPQSGKSQPKPTRSRPETSSSIETAATFDVDLDSALAAFPTPPKSTVTSPTTVSSFETSHNGSLKTRSLLIEPKGVAISCAHLKVVCESDRLDPGGGKSLLVAVEIIGGRRPIEDESTQVSPAFTALDVAIVVDNSLFTSPAALMAYCETARFLASLLDSATDRLAVLCTRPIDRGAKELNVVSQLSRMTIRNIKSTIDIILEATDRPEPAALGIALNRAIDIINAAGKEYTDNDAVSEAYGHIFVLTSNSSGLPSALLNHLKTQIHIVSSGVIPWKESIGTTCSGWKLAPIYSSSLENMSVHKEKSKDSLFNRLRDLLLFARKGKVCGRISDVVLEIEAGQHCSVEMVMGQRDITSLRPGEVITALIRVKVRAMFAEGYKLSSSLSLASSNTPGKPKDVFDELDVMLGASPTPILIAKLTYKHSLLPAGTRCSTIAAAKLKRSLPHAEDNIPATDTGDSATPDLQAIVQKRLVYFLATQHAPRKAVSALLERYGEDGRNSLCPQYITLIMEELKYQARIKERFELPSPIKGNIPMLHDELPKGHFGQGLFNMSNYWPQDWLKSVSDEETNSNSSARAESPNKPPGIHQSRRRPHLGGRRSTLSVPSANQDEAPVSTRGGPGLNLAKNPKSGSPQSTFVRESTDEARRIWGDLRKMSRGGRGLVELDTCTSNTGHMSVQKGSWIKDLAIRNKRSTGNDTVIGLQGWSISKGRENEIPRR